MPSCFDPPRWLMLLAAWIAASWAGVCLADPDRSIAVVTASRSDAAQAAVELATIQLAEDASLVVVERQSIEQVLQEHELALSGLADSQQAISVGRLLGVDLLAVYLPTQDAARLIVLDATRGVRLHDETLSAADHAGHAPQIAAAMRGGLAKQAAFKDHRLRFVALHGRRDVDLGETWAAWIQQVRTQLEQGFTNNQRVLLLERAKLRHINVERLLPHTQAQASLLAAAAHVMVQFARGQSPDTATVTLLISPPGRQEPTTISAELPRTHYTQALAGLIHRASVSLAADDQWQATDGRRRSGPQSRTQEAARLRREAERLFARKEQREAAVFYEAAYALQPDNHRYLSRLAFVLDYAAQAMLQPLPEEIKDASLTPAAAEAQTREAIDLLNYRLQLMINLHERRKHQPDWRLKLVANNGSFPPWNTSHAALAKLRDTTPDAAQEAIRQYCQRHYRFWYGELAQYLQQHAQSPEEAASFIGHWHHGGQMKLKHLSASPTEWFERCLQQYDRWLQLLNDRGWTTDTPPAVRAMENLLAVIDLHKYDRYRLTEEQLGQLTDRFTAAADHPARQITRRAARLNAAIQIEAIGESTAPLRQRDAQIEAQIHQITGALIDDLAQYLSGAREAPQQSLRSVAAAMSPLAFDQRVIDLTGRIKAACYLHPDYQRRRELCRECFYHCLRLNAFSPVLFYAALPPEQYTRNNHTAIGPENLAERVALFQQVLPQLQAGQGELASTEFDRVVDALQTQMREEQARLARFTDAPTQDQPPGVLTPWSELTLLAGRPGLPQSYSDPTWPEVLGFAHCRRHVYYLMRHARDESSSQRRVSLMAASLHPPTRARRLNGATLAEGYRELTQQQREHYDLIRSGLHEGWLNPAAADDRRLYYNRFAWGVLVLPLDGGEPFTLNQQTGLPSRYVQCIAAAEGKLYAWVGRPRKESILVEFDPTTHAVRVLASSERVDAQNPLDNRRPQLTKLLYYDKPRRRLICWFGKQIWQWDLATSQPTKLHEVKWQQDHWLRHVIPLPHHNALLINRSQAFRFFDLTTDTYRDQALPGASANGLGWPGLLLDNRVWMRAPWALYDLGDHTKQELRLPLQDQAPPPMYWAPWCEEVATGARCLIWDKHHLWLATLALPDAAP